MSGPQVLLLSGMSGSGKSVALHALEDAGFFCVDNLPPELLPEFVRLEGERRTGRVAVAVDVRAAGSLPALPRLIDASDGTPAEEWRVTGPEAFNRAVSAADRLITLLPSRWVYPYSNEAAVVPPMTDVTPTCARRR